jgi:hypothetical protein
MLEQLGVSSTSEILAWYTMAKSGGASFFPDFYVSLLKFPWPEIQN